MVQLEEVPDEELYAQQPGQKEDEDDWDTDSGTLHLIAYSSQWAPDIY